jgi:hypothetical protein
MKGNVLNAHVRKKEKVSNQSPNLPPQKATERRKERPIFNMSTQKHNNEQKLKNLGII